VAAGNVAHTLVNISGKLLVIFWKIITIDYGVWLSEFDWEFINNAKVVFSRMSILPNHGEIFLTYKVF